uniref:auxin-induced protein 10A5-like n=1 Tax=Erigeron canadensis TaxID=72917 RepID=UPI001CB88F56|nr:auxin-induced protein 10A5-like [Erigeron canadensis]
MESVKRDNGKKNFLAKTWKRCRSFNHHKKDDDSVTGLMKSKSWSGEDMKNKKKKTPEGFFPVYVGPEKQRFAIKTKYVNHPLFTMLLEDAESEYGTHFDGPIMLPCDVDLFLNVLAEMEAKDVQPLVWSFSYGSCTPFTPSRRVGNHGADHQLGKGYGSYEVLRPSSLIN